MKLKVEENNIRLDKYLACVLKTSRSLIQKNIVNENILVNNKKSKSKYIVNIGDVIYIKEDSLKEEEVLPEDISLDIIYEDEYLIVINKASGMVVHPASNIKSGTLVNALMHYTSELSDLYSYRPGIVHRLDKDTSGLIVVAKTNEIHEKLNSLFKERKVKRVYTALLVGNLDIDSGVIDAPIGRDKFNRTKMAILDENSKEAQTKFKVIKRYKDYTLVNFELITGRTHQIRVHAKYIGHPIYNDPVYTNKNSTSFGQFLHSSILEFVHPIKKEKLVFEAELPKEFSDFIDEL